MHEKGYGMFIICFESGLINTLNTVVEYSYFLIEKFIYMKKNRFLYKIWVSYICAAKIFFIHIYRNLFCGY